MFKRLMIKGCDKITHFDNSDNYFGDNVITLCETLSRGVITLSYSVIMLSCDK